MCTAIFDVQDCRSENCLWTAGGECSDVDWSLAAIAGDSLIACLFGCAAAAATPMLPPPCCRRSFRRLPLQSCCYG